MARQPQKTESELLYEAAVEEWERRQQAKLMQNVEQNAGQIREESKSFLGYVKHAWPVLEPSTPLIIGWGIEAIIDHLSAVTSGDLTRLWVNVPPGFAKSLLLNVLWPSWEWGPIARPWLKYVATSGDEALTQRDGKKFRDLVTSDWYKRLWPEVNMTAVAIGEMNNDKTGARYGVPFSGMMGWRGNRLNIDDPHNLKNEKSPAMRGETVRLFKEGASSRLNNVVTDAIIGVMQMVGVGDISNYVKEDPSYTYLCIPQEFDPTRKCYTYKKNGDLLFEDPRKKEGQLAFPERFPREWVEKEKSAKHGIGPYAYAAQHQQNAIPRGGGLFNRDWFKDMILTQADLAKFQIVRTVRYFDLADTDLKSLQKTGARTAGVKMAVTKDKDYIILHSKAFGLAGAKKDQEIKKVVDMDKRDVEIFFPQDPAAGGKVQGRAMIKLLAGRKVKTKREAGGDKVARAEPFANQCEGKNVYIVEHDGLEELLDELDTFPNASRKDLVDACSGAFAELISKRPKRRHGWSGAAAKLIDRAEEAEYQD